MSCQHYSFVYEKILELYIYMWQISKKIQIRVEKKNFECFKNMIFTWMRVLRAFTNAASLSSPCHNIRCKLDFVGQLSLFLLKFLQVEAKTDFALSICSNNYVEHNNVETKYIWIVCAWKHHSCRLRKLVLHLQSFAFSKVFFSHFRILLIQIDLKMWIMLWFPVSLMRINCRKEQLISKY